MKKLFFGKLRKAYLRKTKERIEIVQISDQILYKSKKIIFALQRGSKIEAKKNLKKIIIDIKNLEKKYSVKRLNEEGSYKAAIEEFVEAYFFKNFLDGSFIEKIEGLNIEIESYLGGICDLTGEILRWAINESAEGNLSSVSKSKDIINEIMEELVNFDMKAYLRTKFDQAKRNLAKIEQINYEVNLKRINNK